MKIEKWREIYDSELHECNYGWQNPKIPSNWEENRKRLMKYILEIDKATEVYHTENEKK